MPKSNKLEEIIKLAREKAGKDGRVIVQCIYGPAAPTREHHDETCCSVYAFTEDDTFQPKDH